MVFILKIIRYFKNIINYQSNLGASHSTQGFMHPSHMFYHWATYPARISILWACFILFSQSVPCYFFIPLSPLTFRIFLDASSTLLLCALCIFILHLLPVFMLESLLSTLPTRTPHGFSQAELRGCLSLSTFPLMKSHLQYISHHYPGRKHLVNAFFLIYGILCFL